MLFHNIFNIHEFELYNRGVIIEPHSGCDCYFGNVCKEKSCMNDISVQDVFQYCTLIKTKKINKMNYDLIVLGSGPGGYVAAIRASQLGMKVAIVEKESLGGICLNWGCIPTKALLKSAQVFEYINHAKDYGIKVNDAEADFTSIIKRSRDVADGMSNGISYLMKKIKSMLLLDLERFYQIISSK